MVTRSRVAGCQSFFSGQLATVLLATRVRLFFSLVKSYGLFPGPVGGGSGVDSMLGAESS